MSLLKICKLYTLNFVLLFGATALTTGQVSAAPGLAIFDGFVGYDSVKASLLDEAKSEVDLVLSSKVTSGDLNNMCVIYALGENFAAAELSCSDAISKAREENVSRMTLRTMKSNLKIVSQYLLDSSSAAD